MSILIVDDSPVIQELLKKILQFAGYKDLLVASSTQEGFEILGIEDSSKRNTDIDLILMDIMLAGMDGRTICKAIKSVEKVSTIPIILISATENGASCLNKEGSPNDFVPKPFDLSFLIEKIEHQLAA